MKTKHRGTITAWWNGNGRDFGFIKPEGGVTPDHFLHKNNITAGTPRAGAEVLFLSVATRKGFTAVLVEVAGDKSAAPLPSKC
jgi:cold shock CspA family protein